MVNQKVKAEARTEKEREREEGGRNSAESENQRSLDALISV